jgi:hypothetical protein
MNHLRNKDKKSCAQNLGAGRRQGQIAPVIKSDYLLSQRLIAQERILCSQYVYAYILACGWAVCKFWNCIK